MVNMAMRWLALVSVAAIVTVIVGCSSGGTSRAGTPTVPDKGSRNVRATVSELSKAIARHDERALCRLVLALGSLGRRCPQATKAYDQGFVSRVENTSISVHRTGGLLRADVTSQITRNHRSHRIRQTLWLKPSDPNSVINPGRVLLLNFGQDAENALVDARPIRDADIHGPVAGTADGLTCPQAKASKDGSDPAGDVAASPAGKPAPVQRTRMGFDIRSLTVDQGSDGSICVTTRLGGPVRAGLVQRFDLEQTPANLSSGPRTLFASTFLAAAAGFASVGDFPEGMAVAVSRDRLITMFRPGAFDFGKQWTLHTDVYADDPNQPLVRHPLAAFDEAEVKSP
jgi:hypothetical protein